MVDQTELISFVTPFYETKDIMHDLTHVERVIKAARDLYRPYAHQVSWDVIELAAHFHGFIYSHEDLIRKWLLDQGLASDQAEQIIRVAWESQKPEAPETLEGKILHDAHMIEGGKTFLIVKSLITGAVRGQTLDETIRYIENNILDQGTCYLGEAKTIYSIQQDFAKGFIADLKSGL